uniref:Uncharacterized protein n=1 Tax=Sinocyclocheilus rhinocerous TaxID=307959 RepID=A0A673FUK4_9TELE
MSCMCLHSFQSNIEEVDPRGRTPLHLAVSLGHLESVRVLLRHGADVSKENDKNWTVLQEAVSTGDPEMVQLVLQRRDYRKASTALGGVPELLCKIREVHLCSPRLHLFDQKYSKGCNIVKYYYNLK